MNVALKTFHLKCTIFSGEGEAASSSAKRLHRQTAESHLGKLPLPNHKPERSQLTVPANGWADCLPVLAEQAAGLEL